MIVKVQLPLAGSGPTMRPVLVYNESRSIEALIPLTSDLLEVMNGELKAFFHAHMEGTNLFLDDPAPWQEW